MAARDMKFFAGIMVLASVLQVAYGAAAAAAAPAPSKQANLPTRMVLGALGGMGGSSICHPLDVIRVQMQVDTTGMYKNPIDAAVKIVKRDGFGGIYNGISAAYLRQWTYGSCRVGIYAFLLDKVKSSQAPGTEIPFWKKLLMGSASGAIGSMAGLPSEVALVRMGADSKMEPALRRGYKNVADCITRIAKEEGVVSLWKGGAPTVIRATLLSSAVLGCYSETKEQLHKRFPAVFPNKDGIPLMFTATMYASLVATAVSNPFDVVKSRVQNMAVPAAGEAAMYSGMRDCFIKSVKAEGPLVLYRGFVPSFVKLAPYTTISLILTDKLAKSMGLRGM